MFGSSTDDNNHAGNGILSSSAMAYTNVPLVEDASVDLLIYKSRGMGLWTNEKWLEEGRPRELSGLNLATWSLLTTSIRQYQTGLRRYLSRMVVRVIFPLYLLWFLSLFLVDVTPVWFIATYSIGLVTLVFGGLAVVFYYKGKHVDEVFHPAVQTVVEELTPKLTEAGYEVVLMVETGSWCRKPTRSFLRFTPLPDEERRAQNDS